MLPLMILGGLFLAGMASSSEERRRSREAFDEEFTSFAGDRLIAVDEYRKSGAPTIRRFRPTMDPLPWEIQVATTADGLEQFAVTIHPALTGKINVTIRPSQQRPIHLRRAFDMAEGRDLAKDGYHANRYRYSHPDQGQIDWFVIQVSTWLRNEPWLFEDPSLYSEMIRARPALPEPPDVATGGEFTLVPLTDKVYQVDTKADRIAAELAALRAEIPELVKAQRHHEQSPRGVAEALEHIKKIAQIAKQGRAEVDAAEGLDEDEKDRLRDVVRCVTDRSITELERALQAQMEGI